MDLAKEPVDDQVHFCETQTQSTRRSCQDLWPAQ